ncbi:MAG: CoA-transferase subunit beta [Anaerolineae bacterium]
MTDPPYTRSELMVVAAAREIEDDEVAFVGMRLPLLSFQLAQSTHAPNAVSIFELGIIRDAPAPEMLYTMGDLPNLCGAQWLSDLVDVMGILQQGLVDVSFIGGAEVDRYGNLNTTYIGGARNPQVRLPGSGGACDLASLAKRHLIIMKHEPRRFVERVSYITSPGYGDGPGWRERAGLPRGGPSTVITTLGILRFAEDSKEMVLTSVHPGVTVEEVKAATGWPLRVAADVGQTPEPSAEELKILRGFDPHGFWTGA